MQFLPAHIANLDTARFLPALSAMLLGFVLVLVVGFAPIPEVHNAAHDTRHTSAFPCH